VHGLRELFERERLADGGIRDGRGALAEVDAPGQEGDRNAGVALPQIPRNLDPVLAAEVDVKQDERDLLLVRHPGELARVGRLGDAIALELEVYAAEEANRVVVVRDDDQAVDLGVHTG